MAKFILSMTQSSRTMIKLAKFLSVMMQISRAFTRLADHTCFGSHSEHDLNLINLKSLEDKNFSMLKITLMKENC